jgi:hypothetical protein
VSSVKPVFLSEEKEFLRKLFVTLELSILPIELCKNIGSCSKNGLRPVSDSALCGE